MKIVLVFTSDKINFESETLYLVTKIRNDLPRESQQVVVPFDADSCELRDQADLLRDSLASALNNNLLKDAFVSNYHNFYFHIFRNIYKWVVKIESILEVYPSAHVVITNAVSGNYMPLYEAEGEINRPLFYKEYDFIPKILYDYLTQSGVNCSVVNWQSNIIRSTRIFLRRYMLLFVKPLYYTYQTIRHRKKNQIISEDKRILLLSRSIAHTHLLYPFIENSKLFYILYSEGFFTRGLNSPFFSNRFDCGGTLYNYFSLSVIWTKFLYVSATLISLFWHKRKYFEIGGIELPLSSVLQEMIIAYYDAIIYSEAVARCVTFSNNIKMVVTAESFTQYPYSIRSSLAKVGDFKLIQIANGAIDLLPNVKFVYADCLAITSESVCKEYQKLHPKEKNLFVFWGDTKQVSFYDNEPKIFKKIIYFSQPYEFESQERILYFLYNYANKNNAIVTVKIHPRDFLTNEIAIRYGFQVEKTINMFSVYIKDYDLAICRTSSILKDVILSGIPFISALFSKGEQNTNIEFIRPEYFHQFRKIYAFNESELEERIKNPSELCEECKRFHCLNKSQDIVDSDIISFTKALISFSNQ